MIRDARPLPLHVKPSKARDGRAVSVVERCLIGERIAVAGDADRSALGTAIHACLALSFTDPRVPITAGEVLQVLDRFDVTGQVPAAAVLRQITAFHDWIERRWPGARAHAEFPVQSAMPDGRILIGGEFTSVAGQTRNNLARLNADGSLDTAFNPAPDGGVYALSARVDGTVVVGGAFTNIASVSHAKLALLKSYGALDTTFTATANAAVHALTGLLDGRLTTFDGDGTAHYSDGSSTDGRTWTFTTCGGAA